MIVSASDGASAGTVMALCDSRVCPSVGTARRGPLALWGHKAKAVTRPLSKSAYPKWANTRAFADFRVRREAETSSEAAVAAVPRKTLARESCRRCAG